MKRKGKIWFFVAAFLIIFLAVTTFTGIENRYGDIVTPVVKKASEIRFGIDIRGGVEVAFVPDVDLEPTEDQMASAQAVVEQRLLSLGVHDYEIYKDVAKGRIILRFPWQVDDKDFNPEVAIQELATAAVLTFREGYEVDDYGLPTGVTEENVILIGDDVSSAGSKFDVIDNSGVGQHFVELTLSPEGQVKFAEATKRIAEENGTISIWMDDNVISNPGVSSEINSNTAIISGSFDAASAKDLADKINAGALPFALRADSYSTISPTLGAQSLRAMIIAGIVAFILVAVFMIVSYRLPGAVATIALMGQTAGTIALISGYFAVFQSFTLTLPGIAGIILAIGIGVDANVITFERIKEELNSGKKLDNALKNGFKRGLTPIIDSNVTVLIVSIILMGAFGPTDAFFARMLKPLFFMFGPSTAGNIYSFGYTLMVGVLLNFVFSVLGTRVMLTSLSKFNGLRNPVLYGGLRAGKTEVVNKPLAIVKNRKRFFAFSTVILIAIVVVSLIFGVQMDVQFKGGAIITYSYNGDLDTSAAQSVINETLESSATLQTGTNTATGGNTLTITMPGRTTVTVEQIEELTGLLNEELPGSNFAQLEVNNVDPVIGGEFLLKCVVAVLAASILILIYIAFRFRKIGGWRGGLTAVVALVHDLLLVYGVFVIFRIPLNGNFIAALLTILGYSINDTVVIYDRIRENRALYSRRKPFGDVVNISINQSLTRSVNTTFTTLIALGSVCIFSVVYGLDSIFTFAFPIMVGMISGVYSTVCIAGPLWVAWENKRNNKGSAPKGGKNAGKKEDSEESVAELTPVTEKAGE